MKTASVRSRPRLAIPICLAALAALGFTARADLTTNLVPAADTTLYEYNPDYNLGGQSFTVVGCLGLNAGFKRCRSVLRFDISSALPAGATVTSANVNFHVSSIHTGAGQTFYLHRLLQSWGEGSGSGQFSPGLGSPAADGECTWNSRFHGSSLWTTPGGAAGTDYVSTASASAIMTSSNLSFSGGAMATDVQAWLDTPGTNYGWVVIQANEAIEGATHLESREDPPNAPTLTVQYTLPAAATPPLLSEVANADGVFLFSFAAEANRAYTVEFRDSLTSGSWTPATNFPAQGTAMTLSVTNALTGNEGYFRVRTP
jgi:hypothetical protein